MRMLTVVGAMWSLGVMSGAGAPAGTALGQAPATAPAIQPVLTDPARLAREWDLDGSGTWALRDGVLALEKAGTPVGKIRRPSALALIKAAPAAGDVTLGLELRSTAPLPDKVPRRDLLLILDYESPTRFYYVHISAARDDVHNGIFLVDNADRRRIDTQSARAPLTDAAWHRVRLERKRATGGIEVYWEGDRVPFMVATDTTLKGGRVGVGSFDDSGEFRDIRVTGAAGPQK